MATIVSDIIDLNKNLSELLLCLEQAPLKFDSVFYGNALNSFDAAFR